MVSTRGRYALRVMVDLAEHQAQGYIPLKEIAQRQEVSVKYLEGILKSLVQEGLLTGMRGKGGGYRLACPPQQCSVGRVLRLTEGSLAPVACLEDGGGCPRSAQCRTLPMWRELDTLIDRYLDGVSIADLMAPLPEGGEGPA